MCDHLYSLLPSKSGDMPGVGASSISVVRITKFWSRDYKDQGVTQIQDRQEHIGEIRLF